MKGGDGGGTADGVSWVVKVVEVVVGGGCDMARHVWSSLWLSGCS